MSAVSANRSAFKSVIPTREPSADKISAVARPIPPPAPVTIVTASLREALFSSDFVVILGSLVWTIFEEDVWSDFVELSQAGFNSCCAQSISGLISYSGRPLSGELASAHSTKALPRRRPAPDASLREKAARHTQFH